MGYYFGKNTYYSKRGDGWKERGDRRNRERWSYNPDGGDRETRLIDGTPENAINDPSADLLKWAKYNQGPRGYSSIEREADFLAKQGIDTSLVGNWYRRPQDPPHLVWNPYWGFQNWSTVVEAMKTGKPVREWELTQNPEWWETYDPSVFYGEGTTEWPQKKAEGTPEGTLGWWEFSPEMQKFWEMLSGRGMNLLSQPLGYTPEAISSWFGKDFDVIRGMERPYRESMLETLGREGQLGTGATPEAMRKGAWDIESKIGDLKRDIFLSNEEKKKQDLLDYTGMAQNIFGTGMGYENMIEAINAARRGERSEAINSILALLSILMWR